MDAFRGIAFSPAFLCSDDKPDIAKALVPIDGAKLDVPDMPAGIPERDGSKDEIRACIDPGHVITELRLGMRMKPALCVSENFSVVHPLKVGALDIGKHDLAQTQSLARQLMFPRFARIR